MSFENSVISVNNISKCFEIYDRPEDRLKQFIMPNLRSSLGLSSVSHYKEFWALRDVSFEIGKGQTVGIIGRNGSGKSTLLQIITGTMSPTTGEVVTKGRVAALLELGSGFNPEFTGRENVYMNASLLGLNHAQTDERFDYIASFADIGNHLDQPVKTYSSGMMLRLAFAVQIAVETEVLIIDEALSVGDARFQLKCFRRLEEIKSLGTTILFVSHATELVRSFCDFGLVLDQGKAMFWGGAKEATVKYFSILFPEDNLAATKTNPSYVDSMELINNVATDSDISSYCLTIKPPFHGDSFGQGGAQLDRLEITGLNPPNIVVAGDKLSAKCYFSWDVEFTKSQIIKEGYDNNLGISIAIADKKGNYVFGCNGFDKNFHVDPLITDFACVEFLFTWPCLIAGDYYMTIAIPLGNLKNHSQLKWYDYLLELKCVKSDKNVFGIIGIDYDMKEIN